MEVTLNAKKVEAVWREARVAYYNYNYCRLVANTYYAKDYLCYHPPFKKDGTHNKQFECMTCSTRASRAQKRSIELANEWDGIWKALERMGLPMGEVSA